MSDFNVGFVIFPGITQLDFTGPFEVLSRIGTPPSISARASFPNGRSTWSRRPCTGFERPRSRILPLHIRSCPRST